LSDASNPLVRHVLQNMHFHGIRVAQQIRRSAIQPQTNI